MPPDLDLIVEVSDSTLDHDLSPKAQLYARAGIPEYWVIDINSRRIHQHREPTAVGCASLRIVASADSLSSLAQRNATLTPHPNARPAPRYSLWRLPFQPNVSRREGVAFRRIAHGH